MLQPSRFNMYTGFIMLCRLILMYYANIICRFAFRKLMIMGGGKIKAENNMLGGQEMYCVCKYTGVLLYQL